MLFEDLARNTSVGKQTDLILLDFSKAFDKVNHSKLIWKFHQYGIRGNALSWIQAFLGNRSQTVVIEGEELGSVPVSSGVPQGSVLGPILFLVFINDLPEKLSSQVRLFADDTAVYLTIGGLDDGTVLQNDLDKLSLLDMEFNPSKCQVVQVCIVHYPGDATVSEPSPHGNSKKTQPFFRTKPSVVHDLEQKTEVEKAHKVYKNLVCENTTGHDAVSKPRNLKQLHNIRAAKQEEIRLSRDAISGIILTQNIVRENIPFCQN